MNIPEPTPEDVHLYTLEEALKALGKRNFKRIAAHVQLALPLAGDDASYFPGFTWVNLTRREAGRFLRAAWSESFAKRGARIKFTFRHYRGETTLWIG